MQIKKCANSLLNSPRTYEKRNAYDTHTNTHINTYMNAHAKHISYACVMNHAYYLVCRFILNSLFHYQRPLSF